jgi:hypothetical protein
VIVLHNTTESARHQPRLHIDTGEIFAHVAGARAASCGGCDLGTAALIADIARLLAEITWLYRSLIRMRLRAANLEAAIRAALSAHRDGESDPLSYLRDELAPDTGGAHGA